MASTEDLQNREESRPSHDGSGAALHTQPAAHAPSPLSSADKATASAATSEDKAMSNITEFSVMNPDEISKFPMPLDMGDAVDDRFQSLSIQIDYIKNVFTKKGKLLNVFQTWSGAMKTSLETTQKCQGHRRQNY